MIKASTDKASSDPHPTPWRVDHFAGEFWIKDAKGGIVTTVAPKYPRGRAENEIAATVAARIVEAVNAQAYER